MKRLLAAFAALALISGCSQLPRAMPQAGEVAAASAPQIPEDGSREAIDLVAYARRVAGLPAEEQRKEFQATSQAFAKQRTPGARLRLALLLALPGTGFGDEAKALALLEPMAASVWAPEDAGIRELTWLLHAQLSERVREQKRSNQFKEQLEALRAIERSLIERGRTK